MQVAGSYGVRIRDDYDALKRTAALFSNAVSYLVRPALENWETLCEANTLQRRQRMLECMIHSSDGFFHLTPSIRGSQNLHPIIAELLLHSHLASFLLISPLFLHSHFSFSEFPKCWHSITDPCKAFVLLW